MKCLSCLRNIVSTWKMISCYYLHVVSLPSSFLQLLKDTHTQVLEECSWHCFYCARPPISLFHLELVEDSQGPFLLRYSAPVCTKAKRTTHFTVSDLGYIYLNIWIENMNVTEVTLEVGVGSPVLVSCNVWHPHQDSFIWKGFAEQQWHSSSWADNK